MSGCNKICQRYKAGKPVKGSRYGTGQKRCHFCNIFMWWDGHHCPCCHLKLRTHPRNTELKAKLRASKGMQF